MRKQQEPPLKERPIYLFFRDHAYIFLAVFLLAPIAIAGVNAVSDLRIYQSMMLGVGWTQAVITGYLSFKIFEVSKRDSELPDPPLQNLPRFGQLGDYDEVMGAREYQLCMSDISDGLTMQRWAEKECREGINEEAP